MAFVAQRSESSQALDRYLAAAGVELEAFARAVGVNRVSVWRYRKGEAMPPADTAAKIESATGGAVPANGWATGEAA